MLVKSLPPSKFPRAPAVRLELANGGFVLIDPQMFDFLSQLKWFRKNSFYRSYAVHYYKLDGITHYVSMHRVVAKTPPYMVCHHINHDSLDNRNANLLNMSEYDHTKLHSWR